MLYYNELLCSIFSTHRKSERNHEKTALLIASAFLFSTAAHAHRVWVETAHTHGGEYLEAELGYGEFPELEPIAKDRLHIFSKPMQLVTEKGKET